MVLSTIGAVATIAPAIVLSIVHKNIYFRILAGVALLYPFGELLQYLLIGPGWIRWHVSDVGFTASAGLLIAVLLPIYISSEFLDRVVLGVRVAFGFAFVQELLKFPAHTRLDSINPAPPVDWVDMIVFTLSFALDCWLIHRMRQTWSRSN